MEPDKLLAKGWRVKTRGQVRVAVSNGQSLGAWLFLSIKYGPVIAGGS